MRPRLLHAIERESVHVCVCSPCKCVLCACVSVVCLYDYIQYYGIDFGVVLLRTFSIIGLMRDIAIGIQFQRKNILLHHNNNSNNIYNDNSNHNVVSGFTEYEICIACFTYFLPFSLSFYFRYLYFYFIFFCIVLVFEK